MGRVAGCYGMWLHNLQGVYESSVAMSWGRKRIFRRNTILILLFWSDLNHFYGVIHVFHCRKYTDELASTAWKNSIRKSTKIPRINTNATLFHPFTTFQSVGVSSLQKKEEKREKKTQNIWTNHPYHAYLPLQCKNTILISFFIHLSNLKWRIDHLDFKNQDQDIMKEAKMSRANDTGAINRNAMQMSKTSSTNDKESKRGA